MSATAVAHPNIALAKYWGKRDERDNVPAVPSVSVTLDGMTTRTTVAFERELEADEVLLDGVPAAARAKERVAALLDRVRATSGRSERARVVTRNDFPTASGLASSASGFAALAVAAAAAAGLEWDAARLSDLARRSSVSAARSLFGGFVELDSEVQPGGLLAARAIAPTEHWDIRVIVAVTHEGAKEVASTDGMRHTAATSPFYARWVERAPALAARVRDAILRRDFDALGTAAEESALQMHATAIAAAPALLYWTGATVDALRVVQGLRARGVPAYATIDAGPHVKVLTLPEHAADVARALEESRGVLRTIAARVGGGARRVEEGAP